MLCGLVEQRGRNLLHHQQCTTEVDVASPSNAGSLSNVNCYQGKHPPRGLELKHCFHLRPKEILSFFKQCKNVHNVCSVLIVYSIFSFTQKSAEKENTNFGSALKRGFVLSQCVLFSQAVSSYPSSPWPNAVPRLLFQELYNFL